MPPPRYTPEEVAQHNSPSVGLWVTRGGTVYDITAFADDHPGGVDVLCNFAGRSIDGVLEDDAYHEHTPFAYEVLSKYAIGTLVGQPPAESRLSDAVAESSRLAAAKGYHDGPRVASSAFLDLERPMMWQLWHARYTKAFYLQQVHIPRHLSHPARFFESDFLEAFTKTPWYVIPILWGTVVMISLSIAVPHFGALVTAVVFALGLVLWTLLEYTVHRFVFHMERYLPDRQPAFFVHFLMHAVHHMLPMDKLRLVMPPALFSFLSSWFWFGLGYAFGLPFTCALMAGGISGYIAYDMVHYAVHHTDCKWWAHFQSVKRHHTEHHYGPNPNVGYGVSSALWDRVFGTHFDPPLDKRADLKKAR